MVAGYEIFEAFGSAFERYRTYRFMSVLHVALACIDIRFFGNVIRAVMRRDELARRSLRFGRNACGVRSYIGYERDFAFARDIHAFVKRLSGHRHLIEAHAELVDGVLLHGARAERRGRMRFGHRLFDARDYIRLTVEPFYDLVDFFLAPYLVLGADFRGERCPYLAAALRKHGKERPVFFGYEIHDLALALHHEAERYALHPARRQLALYLAAKHGRQFIAHEPVKHAARLLRVHKALVYLSRALERLGYRFFGYLVEGYARLFVLGYSENGRDMPGYGFALAVRVGREVDAFGGLCRFFQLGYHLFLFGHDDVRRLEVVFHVHRESLFGKIANMPHRSEHLVSAAEIFLYRGFLTHTFDNYEFQT